LGQRDFPTVADARREGRLRVHNSRLDWKKADRFLAIAIVVVALNEC
jgi:hypothetical protein